MMRKSLKRSILCVAILILAIALSPQSRALFEATEYTWGPQDFTPYTGNFYASTSHVSAYNMRWTSTQVSTLQTAQSGLLASWLVTEYEFRPQTYTTHDIWVCGSETFQSNLPSAYYEFQANDTDDIAVCSGWAAGYNSSTYYYGRLYLSPQSGGPTNDQYIFESEYGMTIPLFSDPLPSAYEQYTVETTYFNQSYSW